MNKESVITIQEATVAALERVLSRIVSLQDAYIVVLMAMKRALKGDDELKKNLESLKENLGPTEMEVEHYFLSILFVDLISEIEIFFSYVIKAVIGKHPKKIGSMSFKLNEIIDAESIEDLTEQAADEYLNKLMYKKPMEYLASICELLSIDKDTLTESWKVYVEAKARRDLGVHNRWACNSTYLRKLEDAGIQTTAVIGKSMFPKYDDYVKDLPHTAKRASKPKVRPISSGQTLCPVTHCT